MNKRCDTFVSIDTETTGLDFDEDRVIQFGAAVFANGKCIHQSEFKVQTDVPNTGHHINQISDEEIANGCHPYEAFVYICGLFTKRNLPILAYNAPFDLCMLANEFRRNDIEYDFRHSSIVDPLVIYRRFRPYMPAPFYKLVNAAKQYGIPYENAHDAAADAAAAGHVWLAQQAVHGVYRKCGYSPAKLHQKQIDWHKDWADSFGRYMTKVGREFKITPWPYPKELECFPRSEQLSFMESDS